jgi:hypothetical protein
MAGLLAVLGAFPASAQQQLGQWCHSGQSDPMHGLYCTVINAHFVAPQGTGYASSIEVLNGQMTPITGSLTFAPGPDVVPYADDVDANGNPICYQYDANQNVKYDASGNPLTVACQQYSSYDITDWDITIGTTHLYRSSSNPIAANSGCGNGYSNSTAASSSSIAYYLCGDNGNTASSGLVVVVVPLHFLMGGKNNGYANLLAQATDSNGIVWQTGLYLAGVTPNCSAVAALDPPSKEHGNPMVKSGVTILHRGHKRSE